jgi:FkbM family methyltransferase
MRLFKNENLQAEEFCKVFLDSSIKRPRYIFGIGEYAVKLHECLLEEISIDGFVDDIHEMDLFCNKPLIQSQALPSNALVIVVALMSPNIIHQRLNMLSVEHVHYVAFMRFSGLKLEVPIFWEGFDEDLQKNLVFYESLDSVFADNISQQTYRNIFNFRLTGDFKYLADFHENQKNQYFEPFLNLQVDDEVFADVGGFDGQTSLEFISRCSGYKAIHIFEPEVQNMQNLKLQFDEYENVYFYKCGLSNKTGELSMIASGSTSKVVENGKGDYQIQLNRLDALIDSSITFLKMDIEGAEHLAIEGAKGLIRKYQPKLAICVYHQGNDFRVIYEKVMSYNKNYTIYLRHYTEGIVETVMYFIPKN